MGVGIARGDGQQFLTGPARGRPALEEILSSSVMTDAGRGQAQLRLVGTTLAQQGQRRIALNYVL